jgi:general L-amino acid transport system permease protein
MTDITQLPASPRTRRPAIIERALGWLRANLFSSVFNSILTLLAPAMSRRVGPADRPLGGLSMRSGPCATERPARLSRRRRVLGVHRREIPLHPVRPLSATTSNGGRSLRGRALPLMILAAGDRRFWGRRLAMMWIAGLVAVGVLMWGGILGLRMVETELWSGLPLTLILATVGMAVRLPARILLALGRRSTTLPAVRAICVGYIELMRGVPLITVLFMASVMLPLFLPAGVTIDKLLRAQVAIILFAAAYLAEVVRGGLQALPKGPDRGGRCAGPELWQKTG